MPDLKRFAETHIEYEVRMLGQEVWLLERLDAERRGPDDEPRLGADGQALLEAAFVHLRLLDEFLGGRDKPDARGAYATDWLPSWADQGFLSPLDRDRVDAKVAHLAWRRTTLDDFQPDEITRLAEACVDQLEVFVDRVASTSESDHFDAVREQIEWFRARDD